MHDAVTLHMDAPPEQVWDLIADVTQIGRYSPETFEAEWLDGATGPDVDVRFRGHVKRNGRGPTYWTTCTIKACEPYREFAFVVATGAPEGGNTWRYVLEPIDGGTDVTESFQLTNTFPLRLYWAVFGHWRGRTNRNGMRDTLEAIKAEVEQADA